MFSQESVYKYRKIINPLYTQDIRFESDLVDSIYNSLSNTNLIESYEFDLNNNNISVTLIEDAKNEDYCTVVNSMNECIVDYIKTNKHNLDMSSLTEEEQLEFDAFITTNLLYDYYQIGTSINIML